MTKLEQIQTIIDLMNAGKYDMALTLAWALDNSDFKARVTAHVASRTTYRLEDLKAGVVFGSK